ncbi:MAG: hypothetical protein IT572_05655 [Deltaproteobacteria bacterium]|nr:hypothetical protein [Deltaproteobacteria bacterium]
MTQSALKFKTIPDLSLRFAAATYEKRDGTDEAEVFQILEELQARGTEAKDEFEQTLVAMAKTNGETGKSYFEKLSQGKPERGFVARVLTDEMKGLWIQAEYKQAMDLWDSYLRYPPGDLEDFAEGLLNSVANMGESCLEHPILSAAFLSLGVGIAVASGGKLTAVGAGAKFLHSLPKVLKSLEILGNLTGLGLTGMAASEIFRGKDQETMVRSQTIRRAGEHFGEALLSFSLGGSAKLAPARPVNEFQTALKNLGRGTPQENLKALAILIRPDPRGLALEEHRAIADALNRLELADLLSLDQKSLWTFVLQDAKRVPAEISAPLQIKLLPHAQEMDRAGLGATLFVYLPRLTPKAQAEVVDAIFSNLRRLEPEDEKRGVILLCNLIQGTPEITGQRVHWENFFPHLEKIFTDSPVNSRQYSSLLFHIVERTPRGRRFLLNNLLQSSQVGPRANRLRYLIEWDQKSPEEMLEVFLQDSRDARTGDPRFKEKAFWEAMEQAIQEGALDHLPPLSPGKTAEIIDRLMDGPMLAIAQGSYPEFEYRHAMTALFENLDLSAQTALYGAMDLLRLLHPHNGSTSQLRQELGGLLSLKDSGIGTIEALSHDTVRIRQLHPGNIKENRLWNSLPDSVQFVSYESPNGSEIRRGNLARFWDPSWSDTEGPLMISIHMTRDGFPNPKLQEMVVGIDHYDSKGRLLHSISLPMTNVPPGVEERLLHNLVAEYQVRLKDRPIQSIDIGELVGWSAWTIAIPEK